MGANPLSADPSELIVDVETPDGKKLAVDDPALMDMLRGDLDQKHQLTLIRSERALTDCRPVSIFSLQSARQLAEETGVPIDKRRFRANVYVDLVSSGGFAENDFVGRSADWAKSRRENLGTGCTLRHDHSRSRDYRENARDTEESSAGI